MFQYTQKMEKRKQRNKDAVGVQNERQACAVTTVQRQCRDARRPVGVSEGESACGPNDYAAGGKA